MRTDQHALEIAREAARRASAELMERFRGIVLFGSRARGDYNADSDVDLLLLLDQTDEQEVQMADAASVSDYLDDLLLDEGILGSVLPVSVARYRASILPFYRNVRDEGIIVGTE